MGPDPIPLPQKEPESPATAEKAKSAETGSRLRRRTIRCLKILGILLGLWLPSAYMILPTLWRHYENHPVLAAAPKTRRWFSWRSCSTRARSCCHPSRTERGTDTGSNTLIDAIAASSLHIRLDSYSASPRRKGQGGAIQVRSNALAPDLALIVERWEQLPEAARVGIVALVKTSGKGASR